MFFNAKRILVAAVFVVLVNAQSAMADRKGSGRSLGGQVQNSVRSQVSNGQLSSRSLGNVGNANKLVMPGNAGNGGRTLPGFSQAGSKPGNGQLINNNLGSQLAGRTKKPSTIGINIPGNGLPGTIKPGTVKPIVVKPFPGAQPTFPPIVGTFPTKPIKPNWPGGPLGPLPGTPGGPVFPPINPNPPGGNGGGNGGGGNGGNGGNGNGNGNGGGHGHGGHHGGCHNHWDSWVHHIGCWVRCPNYVRPCPLPIVDCTTGYCTPIVTQRVIQTLPQVYAVGEVDLAVREVRVLRAADATQGTLYQVFVTNNGTTDFAAQGRVALFGVSDAAPDDNTPRAIESFNGLRAGETAIVEVQMPLAASQFPGLLVAVEVPEGIRDINESNNLAQGEVARLPMAVAVR